jgi:serine/threonine protein kinase
MHCHGDVRDFFDFGRVLGCGSQGTAYEVVERSTGSGYACKSVPKVLLGKSHQIGAQFDEELKNMALCSGHDNVVAFEGVYEDDTHVHLITELARGGELFDYVAEAGALPEARAGALLQQICSGLEHVHSCKVMHRDVKLENFVFSTPTAEGDGKLKLIDFGFSTQVDSDQPPSMVGSPAYVAPEIVKGDRYDQACDVWSTGVLSYAMVAGTMPFDGSSNEAMHESRSSGDFQFECPPLEGVSAGCKDFVSQALTVNADRRPSMSELLEHPWLNEMNQSMHVHE